MNRKCLKCGAYIRERNVCRIVGESVDVLNVHGECGFYNNNKIKRKIMTEEKTSSGSGIGFFGLLTIVFIVLKLTKVIDWSWWWVTAPAWGSVILWLIIVIVGVILSIWANKK